jgi:hypothetical protein
MQVINQSSIGPDVGAQTSARQCPPTQDWLV